MTQLAYRRIAALCDEPLQLRDPLWKMGTLTVTGSAVGGVLSLGLFVLIWGALPVVRPLLLAALVVGGVFGFVLWLRRR
jgi:uncharacterized BrkB/YihY/UPF0761 family membrane protein